MIICPDCDTAQFLQIVKSRVYFDGGVEISEISEKYECTLCENTGKYTFEKGVDESLTGDLEQTTERPVMA